MKTITCTNDNGQSAVFTYDHDKTEFFLVSCDGIYSVSNNISTTTNATTDGETCTGESVARRNIVITANIIRNHRKNRDTLARVFKVKSEGVFAYEEDDEKRTINYKVESIDVEEKGVIRPVVISLLCCDPYFSDDEAITIDMARWCDDWEFELEIPEEGMEFGHREISTIEQIDNESTKSIGLTITFKANDEVVNPYIYNQTTGEMLKLLCTMQVNDKIVIETTEGNIAVELTRDNIVIDYDNIVDEDNDDYIQLAMGENVINYGADAGVENMDVNLKFENKYMFV
jgi:hypothetical protein